MLKGTKVAFLDTHLSRALRIIGNAALIGALAANFIAKRQQEKQES